MENKLKPCPFCGGEATIYIKDWDNRADEFRIGCPKCEISQLNYRFNLKSAIEAWNTRDDGNIDINALFAERDYYKSVAKHVYRVMQEAKELMQYIPRTCSTCYANDMDIREVDNPCWNCKGRGYPNWKWRNADHFREVTEMVDRGSYGSD